MTRKIILKHRHFLLYIIGNVPVASMFPISDLALQKECVEHSSRPSHYSRLLALPYLSWTATKKPYACICNQCIRLHSSRNTEPKARYYISTGIYRCTTLDLDRNFARISDSQESARINAFHYVMPPSLNP